MSTTIRLRPVAAETFFQRATGVLSATAQTTDASPHWRPRNQSKEHLSHSARPLPPPPGPPAILSPAYSDHPEPSNHPYPRHLTRVV
jgi:hypothetical protein